MYLWLAVSRPRRSTRPSALKLYGITELSEAFGIPLDSDSDSDMEFAPTNEAQSGMFIVPVGWVWHIRASHHMVH